MFSANRIVAIDDEAEFLGKLCQALHGMGIPCIPLQYPDQLPGESVAWFQRIRIVFCDLHLLQGLQQKPELNYAVIGSILERMASVDGGPVLLILWTAYPQEEADLRAYLAERHAACMPVEILGLDKKEFSGDAAGKLPDAVAQRLNTIPQLRALYQWDDDVAVAGNACVGAVLRLAMKTGGNLKDALDLLLSALAQRATGKELAAQDPSRALQEALLPLLADKLTHIPSTADRQKIWAEAMPSAVARKFCTPAGAAEINTAFSIDSGGTPRARDRGAVVNIACPSLFRYRFSSSQDEILQKFMLKKSKSHRWMAIQVEAACDYAQQKSPSLPYVLAIEVSNADATEIENRSETDSLWFSPAFFSDEKKEVRLIANVRYVSMISPRKAKSLAAAYRLREQLVNQLAFQRSSHEIRPGIVSL